MALLHLLKGAESISSLRDRETAANMAANAIVHLLGPRRLTWLRRRADGTLHLVIRLNTERDVAEVTADAPEHLCSMGDLMERCPEVADAVSGRRVISTRLAEGGYRVVMPFYCVESRLDSLLLADCDQPPTEEQQDGIFSFLRFYANYLALLDYSELDTLTGLHNRKTFDESFERLLGGSGQPLAEGDLRRHSQDAAYWLAVLDIDRFKLINDNWGHLFGDETLLRFSRLLKQSFRGEDHLFRFGGEEFIVIMRAENREGALLCLERFRTRLAETEFPQIGTVTCSIGFTRVDPAIPSADILGRADEALYFAKANGRNQTCHYESLVAQGRIDVHNPQEGDASVDFDIDALFG